MKGRSSCRTNGAAGKEPARVSGSCPRAPRRAALRLHPGGLALRLFVGVFFVLVASLTGEAHASSGMCSFDAQSIEAPPPLYPSTTDELRGCEQIDTSRGIAHAPRGDHSTITGTKFHKDVAVVAPEVRLPRRRAEALDFPAVEAERGEEHRASLRRPPRV